MGGWHIPVEGCHNPSTLNPWHRRAVPRLAQELDNFLFRQAVATRDLVGLWVQSVEGLEESVGKFLESAAEDERLTRLLTTSTDQWSAEDMLGLADAYLERFPGQDRS